MNRYVVPGRLLLAALFLVLGLFGSAQALPGCAALGGSIVGTECRIQSAVTASGDFEIENSLALHFVQSLGSVTTGGADISIIVHGNFIMDAATLLDANKPAGICNMGGAITLTVDGNVTVKPTAIIRSDSCSGGPIVISGQQTIDINGLVESVGSNKSAFGGVNIAPGGGPITITTPCNLTITEDGVVSSRGSDPGADLVRLVGGCFVKVFGLVESTGIGHRTPNTPPNHCDGAFRPGKPADTTTCVEIVAGDLLVIDATAPHNGQVNADNGGVGGHGSKWIDLFAKGPIQIIGDVSAPFAVHANGLSGANDVGGAITVKSRDSSVSVSGLAIQADALKGGGDGGTIVVQGKTNVTLDDSQIFARGDFNPTNGFGVGGHVSGRSFTGTLNWQDTVVLPDSTGDVRPTGSAVPAAQRGTIDLTACNAPIALTGTDFPVNGAVVPPFPATTTGTCGGAPTFPAYITFPDCGCVPLGCPCVTDFSFVGGAPPAVQINGTQLTGVTQVRLSTASCEPNAGTQVSILSQSAGQILADVTGLHGDFKIITISGTGSCCTAATVHVP